MKNETRIILGAAITLRLWSCAVLWLLPRIFPPFDTSGDLFVEPYMQLAGFVRWDTLYFVRIAMHGYQLEQEWAFQPGLPFLLAYLGRQVKDIRGGEEAEEATL